MRSIAWAALAHLIDGAQIPIEPAPLPRPTSRLPAKFSLCGVISRCLKSCQGAEPDGAVLAQAVAAGGPGAVRARAVGRCATVGSPRDVHARANLRGNCDGLREAVGERAAHQP